MNIRELSKKYKQYVIDLRREFHMYPEASLQEYKTIERIKNELDNMGIKYIAVAGTGVVATIEGKKLGKTIALRGDIDALSVTENNDIDFKSKNDGLMHACGHDCHIAMLLGAGKILNEIKDQLNGTVKLLFQPAEEVAKGANMMIEEGALQDVDSIFGMHVWSDLDVGTVSIEEGARMASADMFTIRVKGKGGHGSAPHQGVDAVVASSSIVMDLQSIVSRELSPFESAVVSVGSLKAGSRFNVIASEAELQGTTRCFNQETRGKFPDMIERVIKNTAQAYRAEAELEYSLGTSVLVNDEKCSKICAEAVEKIGAKIVKFDKIAGGEDFAEYLNKVPGALAFLGVRNEDKAAMYPQHHSKYTIDEDALEIGTALHVQYVLDCINNK